MIHMFLKFPTPIVVWGSFFLAGLFIYLAVAFSHAAAGPRKPFLKYLIAVDWSHKSAITDLMVYLIGKLTLLLEAGALPVFTLFLANAVISGIHHGFPQQHFFTANLFTAFICAAVLMLILDFSGWLSHVAQHYVPVLWELHKVHHSALFLNPLTARRGHTLGILLDDAVHACFMGPPTGLLIALFNLNPADMILIGGVANKFFFMFTLEALQHSHYPINFGIFERVFVSPHMHQIHHSSREEHWDKNFGYTFSFWDRMFKTSYKPKKGELIVYGIGEQETNAYQGLYGVYVLPLIGMWRLIMRKTSVFGGAPLNYRRYSPKGVLWREPANQAIAAAE